MRQRHALTLLPQQSYSAAALRYVKAGVAVPGNSAAVSFMMANICLARQGNTITSLERSPHDVDGHDADINWQISRRSGFQTQSAPFDAFTPHFALFPRARGLLLGELRVFCLTPLTRAGNPVYSSLDNNSSNSIYIAPTSQHTK